MQRRELIDRLADRCGILTEHRDAQGRLSTVKRETQLAVLAAMGLDTDSDDDLTEELRRRDEAPWRRPLPPVVVRRQPFASLTVPLTLDDARAAQEWTVTLVTEDGRRTERRVVPAELAEESRREIGGSSFVRRTLSLRGETAPGYHRLEIASADGATSAACRLIVAPARCHLPVGLAGEGRVWGPAAQLYALRTGGDWGIGGFGELDALVRRAAEIGAGIVGLNPLHALRSAEPARFSPYSPSSRLFLNWIYLDVETVPEYAECEAARELVASFEFQARLVALRENEQVDYEAVCAAKREVLALLYDHFRSVHLDPGTARGQAFRSFVAERGRALARFGTFEALDEQFRAAGRQGWRRGPSEFHDPESPAVARFADERRSRVEWYQWLQWEADRQLGSAGRRSMELGLKVGLYQDLAVGTDGEGFESWQDAALHATGVGVGAPPDAFNPRGQVWGLAPWIAEALQEAGYQPFIDLLAANMRHAGAVRLDHVMALLRLFWVPAGRTAADGAYVLYPLEDLLGVLALESTRHRCLVVGEDLGNVPDELRAPLDAVGVLSSRLLFTSRADDGSFAPPERYPRNSLAAVTTHDMPTFTGWWRGRDIAQRAELGLYPRPEQPDEELIERSRDRARLLVALRAQGLLPAGPSGDLSDIPGDATPALVAAAHRYLGRSPAMVMTFQLEDVVGQLEQANQPGTTDQHPNWRQRLPVDLKTLFGDPRLLALASVLRRERGQGIFPVEAPPPPGGSRVPLATYRLQLHHGFPLARAEELIPYLNRLGVSHVYASPLLQARPRSSHGYDIIDHGRINPEIGSLEDLERFVQALRRRGMGLVLDIVPNHMGVGSDNAWWMSVLEHGQASPYARFFDIDWRPHKPELHGRVLLPILEDHYGRVLERGLLQLRYQPSEGRFEVGYHQHRFPIDPASYGQVLSHDFERLETRLGAGDPRLLDLQSLINAFSNLPWRVDPDASRVRTRLRDARVHRRQLARLTSGSPEIETFVRSNVERFNGTPDDAASFDLLDTLLGAQAYRLAFWRTAADEINYRRFFDINDLAALRVEDPRVFEQTHRLVLRLARNGRLDGLRIDHPDGLYDPAGYYRRLREELSGPVTETGPPLWIVVEKILAAHERLPADWPVDGTTGYEFCNLLGGLFVDPASERAMDRVYHRFRGSRLDFEDLLYDSKRLILGTALASELTVLVDELNRLSESDRRTRDFTRDRLRQALAAVIACFPVYRTYVTARSVTDDDRRYVEWAVARACKLDRAPDTSIYDFIREILLLDGGEERDEPFHRAVTRFAQKFQQVSGPVMAKGYEDTALYIYNRLLSLNEVGGEPTRFGLSPATFHWANQERVERWPHAMLNSSTHDSKRGEDVRVRISVLSEITEAWERAVRRWSALNRSRKSQVDGRLAPSRDDEYALYQTLVGVWPAGPVDGPVLARLQQRVSEWAVKAAREAKVHTAWVRPNEAYERAIGSFIEALLSDIEGSFLREFLPLQRRVAAIADLHILSQVLLKLTSPGVPDIYQGNETTQLTLVDPDNRRPVDFERLRQALDALQRDVEVGDGERAARAEALMRSADDGRAKLYVTWSALQSRNRHPRLYRDGGYRPVAVEGAHAERVVAFARELEQERVVVVAPRLLAGVSDPAEARYPLGAETWGDTRIELPPLEPARGYRNVLTGEAVPDGGWIDIGQLFTHFCCALLE